jgi:chromosome segregation ATPase
MSAIDLEKQSLETHVELCSQRFGYLEEELKEVKEATVLTNRRLDRLEELIVKINDTLNEKENNALKTLVKVAGSTIVALLGVLSGVVWYVITSS